MREREFKTKIWRLNDKLFRYALTILNDREEAEDSCQELYKRLWEMRSELDGIENLDSYVFRILRNISIDKARWMQTHAQRLERIELCGEEVSYSPSDLQDLPNLIQRIVVTMPEHYSTIFHLRDVEGYSMEEISQIVEIEVATARVILSRARKYIRDEIVKLMNYGTE